jgi:hypothetical protein
LGGRGATFRSTDVAWSISIDMERSNGSIFNLSISSPTAAKVETPE